jgi:metal-sulfur cluster biosynthetic enzyme
MEWWRQGGCMISEQQVRAVLNGIVDPCSTAAGCPAGLDEMGLLRRVEVRGHDAVTDVHVVIGVTEFGCLMGAPFTREAYSRLEALPGVGVVIIELDQEFDWDLDDMRGDYRERLQQLRQRRRLLEVPLPMPTTRASG